MTKATRLTDRAAFAGRLARAAGALANRYFNRELAFVVEAKSPQDYVSAADRAVEAFIRGELAHAYPDEAMLGEETGGTVAERTWVVVHRHDLATHLRLKADLTRAGAAIKDMGAGALMLAHVAAGRYEAFIEPHMHAWDAAAGLLLVEEAGGRVLPYPGPDGLLQGGAVIASNAALYEQLSEFVARTG